MHEAGGRVPRRSLSYTVAEETALVALSPTLRWDATGNWVEAVEGDRPPGDGPPGVSAVRPLQLYSDYTRREVHAVFAPGTPFTPKAGTWGILGIIPVPDRPKDYVFFVTFGRSQGDHTFDEGITEDGVLTWQSQPRMGFGDPKVWDFVQHDDTLHSVHLFLRTRRDRPYTYLGRLRYLTHDRDREHPVHFQWQLLPDGVPGGVPHDVAERIGLTLEQEVSVAVPLSPAGTAPGLPDQRVVGEAAVRRPGSLEASASPRPGPRRGSSTPTFRGRKQGDYAERDAKNRALGLAGELLVLRREREALRAAGRDDIADLVRHVAVVEGDGAGYDVASFTPDGDPVYIEVKTTRGSAGAPFFMSANELYFGRLHAERYAVHRVFDYDEATDSGLFYVAGGDPEDLFECQPTAFRLRVKSGATP